MLCLFSSKFTERISPNLAVLLGYWQYILKSISIIIFLILLAEIEGKKISNWYFKILWNKNFFI
jgi:hypothetical protein